jgi:hypothetical protein
MNVHYRKLPDISYLRNLPEWVYGFISLFSCAKPIDNISYGGEPFLRHRKGAGQEPFRSNVDVEWRHRKRWKFPKLNITFFYFSEIYFLTNKTPVCITFLSFSGHPFFCKGEVIHSCSRLVLVTQSGSGNKSHWLDFIGGFSSCLSEKHFAIGPTKPNVRYLHTFPQVPQEPEMIQSVVK